MGSRFFRAVFFPVKCVRIFKTITNGPKYDDGERTSPLSTGYEKCHLAAAAAISYRIRGPLGHNYSDLFLLFPLFVVWGHSNVLGTFCTELPS